MGNPRYSLEDAVRKQLEKRASYDKDLDKDGLNISQAYEAAVAIADAERPQQTKCSHGFYVTDRGELKAIAGAVVGYDEKGKPVVSPMKNQQSRRRLVVYSADDLAKCDGKVALAQGRVVDVVLPEQAVAPAPRKVVTEHREKSHTFSDGTVKKSCTADGCDWGMPTGAKKKSGEPVLRVTHSDGSRFHESFGADVDDEIETSPDDTQELMPEKFYAVPIRRATPVAGEEVEESQADDDEERRIAQAVDAATVEVYGGDDAA